MRLAIVAKKPEWTVRNGGVGRRNVRRMNRAFNRWIVTGRPWVIAKAALTLDGRLTRPPGRESLAQRAQLPARTPTGSAPGWTRSSSARARCARTIPG